MHKIVAVFYSMKMNATSLYVSTCRLLVLADVGDKSSWTDLFRLVPYLRQSLSCTVCGNLLKEPYTPTSSRCQHHVCKKCKGGRKKLKPSCNWCKDYDNYAENLQLRILLQCYKKLCAYFVDTDIYKALSEDEEIASGVNGGTVASSGLMDLIQEGVAFDDEFKSTAGLAKSAYSILPCVYSNSTSTQTQGASTSGNIETKSPSSDSPNSRAVSNGSALYSVMYAGTGNKITIKRKALDDIDSPTTSQSEPSPKENKTAQPGFKKPSNRSRNSGSKRKGCRCGNATATPGKLTCCGQRCPCYVESKPCTECKCKGCRNPHRPDGMKVMPLLVINMLNSDTDPSCSSSMDSSDADSITVKSMEGLNLNADMKDSNISDGKWADSPQEVYTSQLEEVSPSLPATIMMDEDEPGSTEDDTNSTPEYEVDEKIDIKSEFDGDLDPDLDAIDDTSPQSAVTHDVKHDVTHDVKHDVTSDIQNGL